MIFITPHDSLTIPSDFKTPFNHPYPNKLNVLCRKKKVKQTIPDPPPKPRKQPPPRWPSHLPLPPVLFAAAVLLPWPRPSAHPLVLEPPEPVQRGARWGRPMEPGLPTESEDTGCQDRGRLGRYWVPGKCPVIANLRRHENGGVGILGA